MPRYDYTCAQCGQLTEVLHGIHDPGPAVCPNCGAVGTMRKGFSAPAVHFKGSGWAKKDRSTSSSALTKAKAAEGSGDSGSKDSSADKAAPTDSSSGDKKAATASSASTSTPTAKAGSSSGDD